jgi:hypothetical protein
MTKPRRPKKPRRPSPAALRGKLEAALPGFELSSFRAHPAGAWVEFELRAADRKLPSSCTYIAAKDLAAVEALAGGSAAVTGYYLGARHCCEAPDDSDHVLYVLVERVEGAGR